MTKVVTMISLDADLKQRAKQNGVNISEICNNALTAALSVKTEGFDLGIAKLKEKEVTDQIIKLNAELNSIKTGIQQHEENQRRQEMADLEKQKEEAEKAKYCANCGQLLTNKSHPFPAGTVCNGCFMTATGEQIRKWNQK